MNPKSSRAGIAAALMATTAAFALTGAAVAQETFKIGVVTFLSGQAAQSFGVPAWDGGKMLIEKLNAGEAPAPYDTKGFGGMTIEPVVIDEAGGATVQVQEYRNLVQRENVDVVVGYVGSGDCLAVAPVAEELKQFTILYDCGTPRVFEENDYEYVFRTAAHATMDNVGLARYLKALDIEVETFSGINQDYAWGQDSWADFKAAMGQIYPDAKVTAELFPAFGAGQYGTEISALLQGKADVVHSSLWGGDLQALILQALPRGLFQRSQVAFSAGDHSLPPLGKNMPEGVVVGARGAYGFMAPESELNTWWKENYESTYDVMPVQAPYRMAQAILGLKTAVEKAMAENGGKKPSSEELAAAMKGLSWESPGGLIEMVNGNGHQAIQPIGFGRSKKDENGEIILDDVIRFDARCVNPPADMKGLEWINAGFPGAKC
ncbi:ABC transporter substrate-binding protein [Aurantimonas marianensis]|uniref:ABC transporter substrate-binding protein n=1 Tax=Aurantimonas marianensis TaxID=2920428 RepID=A0A9X2H5G4_9HYPH|nr:ABC transporter substrate-binding protein [Aurantimonas marianensis]MCP3054178.1 ABC transporter substrate-binding protein [Aurantimonas marianensis]